MPGDHDTLRNGAGEPRKFHHVDLPRQIAAGPVEHMQQNRKPQFGGTPQHRNGLLQPSVRILQADPQFDSDRPVSDSALQLLLPVRILRIQVNQKVKPPRIAPRLFRGIGIRLAQMP